MRIAHWKPLSDLDAVSVVSETIRGRRFVSPPTRIPAVTGQWAAAFERVGPERFRQRVAEVIRSKARSKATTTEVARGLGDLMDRLGLAHPLRLLRPWAHPFFTGPAGSAEKARVFHALQALADADQLAFDRELAPYFKVEASYAPLVRFAEAPSLPEGQGRRVLHFTLPNYEDCFQPINIPEAERAAHYGSMRFFAGLRRRPYLRLRRRFSVSRADLSSARRAQLTAHVVYLYANYFFRVTLNGGLHLHLKSRDPRDRPSYVLRSNLTGLGAGRERPHRRLHCLFDPALLRPGENEVEVTLRTQTEGLTGAFTALQGLELRLSP